MTNYQDLRPDERVVGADTIRIELVERMYNPEAKLYRFLALKDGQILDIVELACDDWSLREATEYVRNDRWLSAGDAELDLTEAAGLWA